MTPLWLTVPLDWDKPDDAKTVQVFAREVCSHFELSVTVVNLHRAGMSLALFAGCIFLKTSN